MEEEIPLKIIELEDFLRLPSILSKKLQYKQTKCEQLNKINEESNKLKFIDKQSGVILLKQKNLSDNNQIKQENLNQEKELILPKDIILFGDDIDRKKIGLFNKSTNQFSRHLLITSSAALQSLIPSLINAKEWIIISKLKYKKRYTNKLPIHGNVVISLNINHPLVRYEILTGLDLLQQSFNEIKSAYIVIDFCKILNRWFKNYLRQTNQYPSLSSRLLYRYEILTNKCTITLGKRDLFQDNQNFHHKNTFHKINHKSDIPMQIYIDFNSLPTIIYSIQSNNIFIYSINDQYKQILKEIGNGLSLVSVQNLHSSKDQLNKSNNSITHLPIKDIHQEKLTISQQQQLETNNSLSQFYQPNEEEKFLFEKILDNRMRIQIQHQQLMLKAAKLLCFSSINDSLYIKNNQSDSQTTNLPSY